MFYSACLNALFGKLPPADAVAQAKFAGLDAFEIWGWWDIDLPALLRAKEEHGMRMTAMCTRMVPLNDPARSGEYLTGLQESLAVAAQLNCKTLISQIGNELPDVRRAGQYRSIVHTLKRCVPLLEQAGVTLVIEPLNTRFDHPGYYLTSSEEAFSIVREVGSPYVKVLYDVYHQQISEGNLIPTITQNVEWIGHIHIAGHPGRHEVLGMQEIHYPAVLSALKNAGYTGAVGLEYFPLDDAVEGLKKLLKQIPLV